MIIGGEGEGDRLAIGGRDKRVKFDVIGFNLNYPTLSYSFLIYPKISGL